MSMTIEEAVSIYPAQSITKLAKQCGVSPYVLTKHIKMSGQEILRINHCSLNLDETEINRLYHEELLSTYQIAKKIGCNDETIRTKVKNPRTIEEADKLRDQEALSAKLSSQSKKLWIDQDYKSKVLAGTSTAEYKYKLSIAAKQHRVLSKWVKSPEGKQSISAAIKQRWQTPEYRAKQQVYFASRIARISEASKESLTNPTKRKSWLDKLRITSSNQMAKRGFISSTQRQLYYILSISDIIFYEEGEGTRIGPFYIVDCIIPKQQGMNKDLIVEVQGEYWHNLKHVIIKDKQKATYVKNHTDYDLLYLDELHMSSWTEVQTKLSQYGLSLSSINTNTNYIEIRKIDENQAKIFYQTFHYSNSIRKGAITFGAFSGDRLIACISYTYPIRTQVAASLDKTLSQVMEISRAARATNIVCPNLMSWLIGQTRTKLPKNVDTIISYSDYGEGHDGTIYKASGFVKDRDVAPDYEYRSINGKYHKKTIWDFARKFKMSESEYADKHNLVKIIGGPKARWIYRLSI